ncbi:hypothetical protein ACFQFQ_17075 [Sulfitobacter porphyrae]|uniref:HEAT repeat domain-containing protein n=1 Tax=Sulfitobacter porphyrae TaxID=1246864 RepID=A0ABW2B504_9RHOB|nr:hypothetical protein GCM10007928_06600 [Sulfitobacter porphyrae]
MFHQLFVAVNEVRVPKMKTVQKKLLDAHGEVFRAIAAGYLHPFAERRFEKARLAVHPTVLVSLDEAFRRASRWQKPVRPKFGFLFRHERTEKLLEHCPWLARVAIHSGDGYLRERAVRELQRPEENAMDLAALLCRCNDHVPQVRELAIIRWAEICRLPRLEALVPVLPVLLDRVPHWQRGGYMALELVRSRPDFRYLLEAMFLNETSGRLAKRLRYVLRKPDLDVSLGMLATGARSTFVRAVATQAVLQGETRYQLGYGWKWIDKTISMRRRVPDWEKRRLDIPDAVRTNTLRAAASDKSVAVRKLAVDHLIITGPAGYEAELATLRQDKSCAVQWRMDYFDKKWSGKVSEHKDD